MSTIFKVESEASLQGAGGKTERGLQRSYGGYTVKQQHGYIPVGKVIETAKKPLYTGHVGEGKIFAYNVQQVVKVPTGEEDLDALKDDE